MEDQNRYIYFYTLDHTGTHTTSGYTLPITPFTFIPIFDDGSSIDYSKYKILWDFGDGTTSESLTAVHSFSIPNWYNVKCYVLGKNGIAYESSFSQLLLVKDYISDTLVLSGFNNKTEAGTIQNPFEIFRFNSWQSYSVLSASNYDIKVHIDGNNAPILNVEEYNKDKWSHLKPYARIETFILNNTTGNIERLPVNTINTSNTEIYVKLFNKSIIFCDKFDSNSCLAGTSGSTMFYYIDDLPHNVELYQQKEVATIHCSFDTTKFKDNDRYNKNYTENKYAVLNQIYDSNTFSVLTEKINPKLLTITSNGIDDDKNGKLIHTFDIYQEKYINQKIPFVVKSKDISYDGFISDSKYIKNYKITNNLDVKTGEIYLELRDSRNNTISNVKFYDNFGSLSNQIYGGIYKGYLTYDQPFENVYIYARTKVDIKETYLIDSKYAIIGEPQATKVHNIQIIKDIIDPTKRTLKDTIFETGLSGIYSSCITSTKTNDGNELIYAWIVDADREQIKKYNLSNNTVVLVYDNFVLPNNSSPSNICSDKYGNVWVTLYDSISTVRINNTSNLIDKIITPSLANITTNYENSVTPASVDTDIENNIWISYSNQLSSFVEKYDVNGNFIFNITTTPNFESTELITDLSKNAWVICKDLSTSTKALSDKHDKVLKMSKDGVILNEYNINGSLWNITLDTNDNIWTTRNINEISRINTTNNTISTFKLDGYFDNISSNYISNLEGLACTTDNNILIVDNKNHKLCYFDADIETKGFIEQYINFGNIETLPNNRIQDKITAYGDWNGFRHINKYQHIFQSNKFLEGKSNLFSIYDSYNGKYDIRKINENFNPSEQIKSYRFQEYLTTDDKLFDGIIGSAVGTISSKPTELGKLIYEKISNFTDNIANIDTCNIKSLKSMYQMLNSDLYQFSNNNLNLPADIGRLVDLFSVKYSKLKGSRNKFDQNFKDNGYNNQEIIMNGERPIYGVNKGPELEFSTAILSAGISIIAFEKFSETYKIINTDILSSSYVNFIDPINKTYTLSSYHPYWGWGLVLPDTYTQESIAKYYKFYEYTIHYSNLQTEGLINWSDKYTTIYQNLTSIDQWDEIRENMILYSLAKGLNLIKY